MTPDHDETRDLPPEAPTQDVPGEGTTGGPPSVRTADFPQMLHLGEGGTAAAPDGPPTVALRSAVSVPGYEILAELGRGGMGVVYKARQVELNRVVALKMVLRGAHLSGAERARFRAEAEAVAAIRHPHVVQVFGFGEHEGQPFFAMEFLDGGSLADLLASGGLKPPGDSTDARTTGGLTLPARQALVPLMEQIARGVGAAHDLGIVHRDLKPANVLLSGAGEPKVTDFGLAKRGTGGDLTHTGAIMGTPHYMSPEQAGGRTKFVGPPADVWALGVMLYECLTGIRPFAADSVDGILFRVLTEQPARPRKVLPSVPRDLELICLKCLEKEPTDRYPTANELADDLRRSAAGESVSVRAAGPAERVLKWARRKPTAAAAWGFSSLAALLAVVVFVVFGFWRQAESAKGTAEDARDKLNEALGGETRLRGELQLAEKKLERLFYSQTILLAHQAWWNNDLPLSRRMLARTREDLRAWEYQYVHRLCHADIVTLKASVGLFSPDGLKIVTFSEDKGDKTSRVWDAWTGAEVAVLKGHTDRVRSAKFSQDGSQVVTTSDDNTARVWDVKTGAEVWVLKGHQGPNQAEFSLDGSRLLTVNNFMVQVWDLKTGAEVVGFKGIKGRKVSVDRADFSPDGLRVLIICNDKTARLWDANTGAEVMVLEGHEDRVRSAEFSRDGSRILTISDDTVARIWDAKTGAKLAVHEPTLPRVSRAWLSPDGSRIVTLSGGKTADIWEVGTGETQLVATLEGHTGEVQSAQFSPDGSHVVTSSDDKTARIWDSQTGAEVVVVRGHTKSVGWALFSPDGSRVLTRSDDGTVRVWDARTAPAAFKATMPSGPPAFSPDGSRVITIELVGTARVWDVRTGAVSAVLKGNTGWINSASFGPDGSRVVTVSGDKTARVWDAKSGAEIAVLKHTGWINSASFGPDGSRVVTVSGDKTARVWDARTGVEVAAFNGHSESVTSALFSPDGSRILTIDGKTSRVWEAKTGTVSAVLEGHTDHVAYSGSFSPDGLRVVTAGVNARVWDSKTGTVVAILTGHTDWVRCPSFSPDGSRVVTVSDDKTARVWDAMTGAVIAVLEGHATSLNSASFSPDGLRVVTASDDETARVWDANSGAEVASLKGHTGVVESAVFSQDGLRILTTSQDGTARVWDASPRNHEFVPKPVAPAPRAK